MRLRSRLLILVLAVLVPAVLAAGLGIGYIYNEGQKANRQSMRETTRALALGLDKEFARREAILRTLAASPALDQADIDTFYRQARAIAPTWDTAILLSDTSQQQLMNTRLPLGAKVPAIADIRELRQRYGPDASIVSDIYLAPVARNYSFSIEIPVKRGNRILYYLEMAMTANNLQSVLENQRMPAEWLGTIIDRTGTVAARTQEADKFAGKKASGAILQKILKYPEGLNNGVALNGQPVTAFFSRAPSSGWTFVVSVPNSEIRRPALNAAAVVGGISLLLLGLAVMGALALARSIVRPVEALRLSAEQLRRGEPVAVAISDIAEMDAVNAVMARASEDIRSGKAELERRVAEAVAVAERSQRALLQGQKLEALGRLTGGIAHDFNNVLQTLTTGLQLAQLSTKDPRIGSTLEACQRAVQRAAELTRQLMAFGRVQDARQETVELSNQIQAMIPLLKGALRSDIDFRIDVPGGLWPVTIDPLQFELALLNLTINARDAMPRAGVLRLEARNEKVEKPGQRAETEVAEALEMSDTPGVADAELEAGDYVRLAVTDSGDGMSQEVLVRALDPFFTTKSVGKGSGMGLPQAYGFARQSGGTLILQSRPGEGTSVILYLPKAVRQVTPARMERPAPSARNAGDRLLFVEDDPLVREVVRPALEEVGFHVTEARDGEEALALLNAGNKFDLVFSDIVMPGSVSGIDLAWILQERFPEIRVMLATGYSERRIALPGVRTLAKPYDVAEIVRIIQGELGHFQK